MLFKPEVPYKFSPTAEFRFFIYEPGGDDFIYFKSVEDRNSVKDAIIMQYCDDGWDEEVERILAGEVTHTCEQVNVRHKPSDDELDEEGCDGEGTYWGELDTICGYSLTPLAETLIAS